MSGLPIGSSLFRPCSSLFRPVLNPIYIWPQQRRIVSSMSEAMPLKGYVISVLPHRSDMVQALRYKRYMESRGMNIVGISLEGGNGGDIPPEMVENLLGLRIVDGPGEGVKVYPNLPGDLLKLLMVGL